MTTFQAGPAAPGGRVSAGEAVEMRAGPPVQVRLPAGGWQVGFRTRPDGRTVVEVADPDDALAGLVASAAVSILSIDAGWAGWARDPAAAGGGGPWPSDTPRQRPTSPR
jgi:hypothetical protein